MNIHVLKRRSLYLLLALPIAMQYGCGSSSNNTTPSSSMDTDPAEPAFSSTLFGEDSATVNNPYFPLEPGVTTVFEGLNEDGETERVEMTVSHLTREVNGVDSAIVLARGFVDDEMVEETFDWYAQDSSGNVWFMGEASTEFEDGEAISTEGSWESGLDVAGVGSNAVAGIFMKTDFTVGDTYRQEFYAGIAEDMGEIFALDVNQTLADGNSYTTLQTRDWNPLETDSLDEYNYYVSGEGPIAEEKVDGSERLERVESLDQKTPEISADDFSNPTLINNPFFPLHVGDTRSYEVYEGDELIETIEIEVLSPTEAGGDKTVNGIPVVVQRDRVRDENGNVIEDTYDWFAQDDDGNVWYLGENVTNYNYDDDGNFLGTDSGGSFEWGIDGAMPGILMPAEPRIGESYRQEYYEGEAEDIGAFVAADVKLEVSGNTYTTLMTEEWNPLEPEDVRENKYYAPGIGVVREEKVDGSEYVILVDRTTAIPDVSAATFSNPRVIDNPLFPLNIGEVREYEVYEDEELIETVTIEILDTTDAGGDKTVNGVPVVVQRDRVRDAEGLIIEDTYDWFAQDDAGNVWYMGETVTNYHYDDEGNLLSTDNGGSFEWGTDGALPGIQMYATPAVGQIYRQEFYEGEAEDMASILETDVSVTVSGTDYTTLKTLDWNPLSDERDFEFKYYAPGVGVVREEKIDGSEYVILVDTK